MLGGLAALCFSSVLEGQSAPSLVNEGSNEGTWQTGNFYKGNTRNLD